MRDLLLMFRSVHFISIVRTNGEKGAVLASEM